jgi:hypothetical protein
MDTKQIPPSKARAGGLQEGGRGPRGGAGMMRRGLVIPILILIRHHAMTALASPSTSVHNAAPPQSTGIPLLPGEAWWGGRVTDARLMPYDARSKITRHLDSRDHAEGNQTQPFLISSKGRYVWSDRPFTFEFSEGALSIRENSDRCEFRQDGGTLAGAFAKAAHCHFPTAGKIPAAELFAKPQYNTWIELLYEQSEERILNYARDIIKHGFPPGVLMIDDNWQEDYGTWDFSARRFSNPGKMISELHEMGFRVMLWVCPFASPDSETCRQLLRKGFLLREPGVPGEVLWSNTANDAAMIRWWNGVSAVLDLSNPGARSWLKARLDRLVTEYGVDGFKFDAGDSSFYATPPGRPPYVSHEPRTPEEHTMDFAGIGLSYPFNEYRACWRMAGTPLAQRLRDKDHSWEALGELIPGALAQGVMGYAFTCPDMIGGGLAGAFDNPQLFDPELVVRSAQVHALMPMMQFSVAPWRVLPPALAGHCRDAARLHEKFGPYILECAGLAAKTGTPIVRPLAWQWPDGDYEHVADQYMLGSQVLVAPVVEKGVRARNVVFPPGRWIGADGWIIEGPCVHKIDAPLDALPYYTLSE